MFNHVPGFIMFRDPTKWYTLIAISYAVLIPFAIFSFYDLLAIKVKSEKSKLQLKINKYFPQLFIVLVALYLLFLIWPAILGQLTGTFIRREVPSDYIQLKNKLVADTYFNRVLWVPNEQRFAFTSPMHPAIEANPLFFTTDAASLRKELSEKKTEDYLSDLGVKYIIIP